MASPATESVEPVPTVSRRRVSVVQEGLLALLAGLLLVSGLRWSLVRHLGKVVPGDLGDPLLQTWELAWVGHALARQPLHPFDANLFAPLQTSLGFSDSLLGYAPAGLLGSGPGSAVLRYDLLFLFAYALAFAGAYVLARQLGGSRGAAAVAGAAFAFNPWRTAQVGHLNILSSGGIPLALALLARGHGVRGRTPGPVRPGWAFAGWVVAAWQVSLGFGIGLQFAYLLAVLSAVALVRAAVRRVRPPTALLRADALGAAVFLVTGVLLSLPYRSVVERFPESRRDLPNVDLYSPPLRSLITAPAESAAWGQVTSGLREGLLSAPEMSLAPGLVVTVLAVLGLLVGRGTRRRRLALVAVVAVCCVLALGTQGPLDGRLTYVPVFEHLPGWQGVRTPGRLVTLAWLALGLLAVQGVDRLRGLLPSRRVGAALSLVLVAGVLVEGRDHVAYPSPPLPPAGLELAALPEPVLVLPTDEFVDQTWALWSTDGFPRLVNGSSGFLPRPLDELRKAIPSFPDPAAVAALRAYGVRTVVAVPQRLPGTPFDGLAAREPVPGSGVTVLRRDDTAVVFDLGAG
ncbi:MAG: hypothetical protein JWM64_1675 [Frankiales bacterium]|nr:hypothetical protein [Frankiales bacterium]